MQETDGKKELILTLSSSVTAKEIMEILRVNPQWRISGNMLKILFDQLVKSPKDDIAWIDALTKQVGALEKKKKAKKKD